MSLNMEKKVGQIKKIKVLQFIHGLSMGGAETIVKNYILKLDRTKFEPILLCYGGSVAQGLLWGCSGGKMVNETLSNAGNCIE